MKRATVVIAIAVLSMPAIAQTDHGKDHMGMDMKSDKKAEKSPVHKASGTVKKIDPAKHRVTIAHGPVDSLKWPGMTMAFTLKDKALMDKLAVDKKIDFEFVQQGRDYVVTSVK